MTSEFEQDLDRVRNDLADARKALLAVVTPLRDADLDAARRGGWTVRRVLEHVIQSEWLYGRLVLHLRGLPVPGDAIDALPSSPELACDMLGASRAAFLRAIDGVDEDAFYRLAAVGHEEYSVVSIAENDASHDREHAAQVTAILSS